ncbi:MAG: glycosyltransferase [Acidobacteriota bacterium]
MIRALLWVVLLPLQILLVGVFLLTDALHALFHLWDRPRPALPSRVEHHCSIIVLNWNGRHLLEEGIPPLVRAVRRAGGEHQILVVDNGSTDDSIEWLRREYPGVDLLALPENLGFAEGNNRGVEEARHDIVLLLNNDMIVDEDFLNPLLDGFNDPKVFAVTAQVEFPPDRRREETGYTRGRFRGGFLHLEHAPIKPYHHTRKFVPVLWAGGGSSAFRRDRFLELGGFDPIFSPCYFEDTDLSYRAWRRGWRVQLAADSKVLHRHRSSTSRRFSPKELETTVEERRIWYIWRNYQLRTLVSHLFLLPWSLTKWLPVRAYARALSRLPRVLQARIREPRRVFTDREILGWARQPLRYFRRFQPRLTPIRTRPEQRLRILIVSAYLPHLGTHGGAGRVFQLLRRMACEHEVSLISFVETEQELAFARQAREVCADVRTVFRTGFLPLSWFPYEPFEEFNVEGFAQALEELLCEKDFDLVHFEWTQMALYSHYFEGIPRLLTEVEVNYAAHRTQIAVTSNPWKRARLFYNTLQTLHRELELCRKVDRVVCVTDEDRGYLEGYVPDESLAVVNTGVDSRYFQFEPKGTQPGTLVFVGAFRHAPNLDAMDYFTRMIFPRILDERPDTRLFIVGSAPPPEIQRLGRHPNITVTGYVEDIREYYRLAQVVVVPLRTGVGIRGKILEAWAAGRATIATPLACQGLRAVHGENIIVAADPDEFVLWTLALLRNPEFCSRLGVQGRHTVEERYDWDLLGRRLSCLYANSVRKFHGRHDG